jgi:hypothetical protein
MMKIKGELCQIRDWVVPDAQALFGMSRRESWRSASLADLSWTNIEAAEQKVIEWTLGSASTQLGVFPVTSLATEELRGLIGMRARSVKSQIEFELLYFFVGDSSAAKQEAIEATQLWVQFAHRKWGLREMHCRVDWPAASEHLNFLEAVGLRSTGRHENGAASSATAQRPTEIFCVKIQ